MVGALYPCTQCSIRCCITDVFSPRSIAVQKHYMTAYAMPITLFYSTVLYVPLYRLRTHGSAVYTRPYCDIQRKWLLKWNTWKPHHITLQHSNNASGHSPSLTIYCRIVAVFTQLGEHRYFMWCPQCQDYVLTLEISLWHPSGGSFIKPAQ